MIPIGKRVVAIARSWSLDDSAAGMDGARLSIWVVMPGLIKIGGGEGFILCF